MRRRDCENTEPLTPHPGELQPRDFVPERTVAGTSRAKAPGWHQRQ